MMRSVLAPTLLTIALAGAPLAAHAQPVDGVQGTAADEAGGEDPAPPAPAASGETSGQQVPDQGASTTAAPTTPAIGTGEVPAIVGSLSPLIEDVQVVGPWQEDDRSGVWRAVMARDPAQPERTQFFLQQIAPSVNGAQILRSVPVGEISRIEGSILGYTADEPTEGQEGSLTLFFEIVPDEAEISETYELHAAPDGTYEFGPSSN